MNSSHLTSLGVLVKKSISQRRSAARALAAIVVLAAGFGAQGAWAACKRTVTSEFVFNLDMGTIVINPDLPVGGVIASKTFSRLASDTTVARCTNGGTLRYDMLLGTPVAGFSNVYSTDVKGIGIRLRNYIDASQTPYYFPYVQTVSGTRDIVIYASSYYEVELIKTDSVTGSGSLNNGQLARSYGDDGKTISSVFVPANGVTIVTPSCTVDTGSRNIAVQLGKVAKSSFTGIGSTAGARLFNIQLNCSAGSGNNNTVYLRMDATPDPSGQQGVLQVSQTAGAATGVGIQVLDKASAPVKFGEDALVGASKDGSYILPYTARYYQTAPNVTSGQANGVATFTINYK
jgi:type 1 fimbria pilin